ncbi:MAG: YHS domain-containing protein [Chloroflexota bacterium]
MLDMRAIAPDEDPVCAMRTAPAQARQADLSLVIEDREYVFCSQGCLLEFRDDPAWFLDPGYRPTPM